MFIILSDEIFLIHLSEKMINMFMMKTNVPCLFGFFFIFFWSNQFEKLWFSQKSWFDSKFAQRKSLL